MNGDVGKPPSGTIYNAGSESGLPIGPCEYLVVNGIAEGAEGLSPITPSAPQESTLQSFPLTQLKQMLSQQLEYYFSRENLANDTYLLSQMDNDQYVPIWTVANFNQVKKLTKDIKLITEVLRESPNVQVDEDGVKVRPNHKRCIVILREIPDSTPLEDVKNLFSGENCPRFISCEFAHNSSWYVTFESDDDAQRAYRYLREEVQEFQGKPIMARIKAKPMNRLPLPPVTVKNGFRTTPPPTAVYDPGAFPPGQQRFIYTNGTPGQPVTFNHVPVFQPPYGTQQFYAWPATSAPGYLDISSVFSVNGLAPQTFKPTPYRPNNTRPRKISRVGINTEQTTQNNNSGAVAQSKTQTGNQVSSSHSSLKVINKFSSSSEPSRTLVHGIGDNSEAQAGHIPVGVSVINSDGFMDVYRYMPAPINLVAKDIVAPRHRRKKEKDDNTTGGQAVQNQRKESKLVQFDLVDEAFPPLPGFEAGTHSTATQSHILNSNVDSPQSQGSIDGQPQSQWGENRLADVVKGTAKSKTGNKESGNLVGLDSPRANSPIECNHILAQNSNSSFATIRDNKDVVGESAEALLSTVTLTPPSSPEKIVPASLPVKCTMADKSTKTDDALLNGDLDILICPTTTNAATMTTVLPIATSTKPVQVEISTSIKGQISSHKPDVRRQTPSPTTIECSSNPPRKSYAQVTQHQKDFYAQKDKQVNMKNVADNPTNNISGKLTTLTVCTNSNNVNMNRSQLDNNTRENGQQRDSCNHNQKHTGSNRNGSRATHERSQRKRVDTRTSQLRDFVRPQSPK